MNNTETHTFNIGDRVKWAVSKIRDTSRDKGNYGYKAKVSPTLTGIVEEILQPGERRMSGVPARNHLSYLVRVGGRLYQPPVSRLGSAE